MIIHIPKGFLFAGICSGIKKDFRKDLGLIFSSSLATVASVFTENSFQASPVIVSRDRLKQSGSKARAILVNSGNANCGLGKRGIKDALKISKVLEKKLKLKESEILLASTGVIGEPLPVEKICQALPELVSKLSEDGCRDFAQAIMTTDSKEKISSCGFKISGKKVNILGFAKGAGMIQPHLATMLAFILTDAQVSARPLKMLLKKAVAESFNRITVEGDTSTNDTVFALANGASGVKLNPDLAEWEEFEKGFIKVCKELARKIVEDGEGATKWFVVQVKGAKTKSDAEKIARKIANSPLVKTAIYASDPNWGRIIASAGSAGVKFNSSKIKLIFEEPESKRRIVVLKNGAVINEYLKKGEQKAKSILKKSGFKIILELGEGGEEFEVLTCDLTEAYIRINAEYRS